MVTCLIRRHGQVEILFVGKDKHWDSGQLLVMEQLAQLLDREKTALSVSLVCLGTELLYTECITQRN